MHAAYRRTSATQRLVPFSADEMADAVVAPLAEAIASRAEPSHYGAARRPNWAVAAILSFLHLLMLAALVKFDVIPLSKPVPRPIVVELIETPSPVEPPEPAELTPPDLKKPPLVAPEPVIVPPAPSPASTVVVVQSPKVEAVVPAKPAEGPPAPVTPPDFSADYLNNPPPRYPMESRRLREQGTVIVKVLVTAEGAVQDMKLTESSGHSRLDRAAMAAIRNWRFAPAKQAGKAVAAWVIVPIPFVLKA